MLCQKRGKKEWARRGVDIPDPDGARQMGCTVDDVCLRDGCWVAPVDGDGDALVSARANGRGGGGAGKMVSLVTERIERGEDGKGCWFCVLSPHTW